MSHRDVACPDVSQDFRLAGGGYPAPIDRSRDLSVLQATTSNVCALAEAAGDSRVRRLGEAGVSSGDTRALRPRARMPEKAPPEIVEFVRRRAAPAPKRAASVMAR